jgi:hypothetical protein
LFELRAAPGDQSTADPRQAVANEGGIHREAVLTNDVRRPRSPARRRPAFVLEVNPPLQDQRREPGLRLALETRRRCDSQKRHTADSGDIDGV